MAQPDWINVLVKYCPVCCSDYPHHKTNCPRCGQVLIEKMIRKPTSES